jgi:hypothetical protein
MTIIKNVKLVITFSMADTPGVRDKYGSLLSGILKVTITDFGDRAKVTVTGRMANGGIQMRSADFRLRGYPQYPECPPWLQELVNDARGLR